MTFRKYQKMAAEFSGSKNDIFNFIDVIPSSAADDGEIANLLVSTFISTTSERTPDLPTFPERIKQLRDVATRRRDGEVMVCLLARKIIGTFSVIRPGTLTSESWVQNAANLRCVAIDPSYQGFGISRLMLTAAEVIARESGSNSICLHVQGGATGVAKLYENHGYRRDRRGDLDSFGYRLEGYVQALDDDHLPV